MEEMEEMEEMEDMEGIEGMEGMELMGVMEGMAGIAISPGHGRLSPRRHTRSSCLTASLLIFPIQDIVIPRDRHSDYGCNQYRYFYKTQYLSSRRVGFFAV